MSTANTTTELDLIKGDELINIVYNNGQNKEQVLEVLLNRAIDSNIHGTNFIKSLTK